MAKVHVTLFEDPIEVPDDEIAVLRSQGLLREEPAPAPVDPTPAPAPAAPEAAPAPAVPAAAPAKTAPKSKDGEA